MAQVQENNKLFTRPVWAEISESRLLANYQKLCRMAGPQADVMAVVKANAYGHDVLACAPLLADAGADSGTKWLGVTSADEGAAVRAVCPHARILLMSGVFRGEADTVIDQRLTPVVWDDWQLDLLEQAATVRGLPPASIPVHLEIDTGMSRQGLRVLGSEISRKPQPFCSVFAQAPACTSKPSPHTSASLRPFLRRGPIRNWRAWAPPSRPFVRSAFSCNGCTPATLRASSRGRMIRLCLIWPPKLARG